MQGLAGELVFPTGGIGASHRAELGRVGPEKDDRLRRGVYGARRFHLLKITNEVNATNRQ